MVVRVGGRGVCVVRSDTLEVLLSSRSARGPRQKRVALVCANFHKCYITFTFDRELIF